MSDTSSAKKFQFDSGFGENSTFVKLHTNFELMLGGRQYSQFFRPLREEGEQWERLGSTEKLMVQMLYFHGVKMVTIHPYDVTVEMGPLFSHDEVIARLRELFTITYLAEEIIEESAPTA